MDLEECDNFYDEKCLFQAVVNKKKYATVKILKFETPQTIAIIVLKTEKFYVTLH